MTDLEIYLTRCMCRPFKNNPDCDCKGPADCGNWRNNFSLAQCLIAGLQKEGFLPAGEA